MPRKGTRNKVLDKKVELDGSEYTDISATDNDVPASETEVADFEAGKNVFGIRAKIAREQYELLTGMETRFNLERGDIIEMAINALANIPADDIRAEIYKRNRIIFDSKLAELKAQYGIED